MPTGSDSWSDAAPQTGRLIHLRGHQAAEQLLADLTRVDRHSPQFQALAARALSLGRPLLAAIVRHLDCAEPQILSTLGQLIMNYPVRTQAVQALVRVANDRRAPDGRRLGAMTLLWNYYLHPMAVDDFLARLQSPARSMAVALVRAVEECYRDRELLREYHGFFEALYTQPPDILHGIVSVLAEMPGAGATGALQLLALHPYPAIMHEAIEALAGRPAAGGLRALAVLEPNLPAEAAHVVSRLLHKHRLSGYYQDPLLPANSRCRALVSAIDPMGARVLWLQVPSELKDKEVALMGLVLSDLAGVVESVGLPACPTGNFAAPAPIGTVHRVVGRRLPGHAANLAAVSCLEVPFSYGLQLLREAVALNWQEGMGLPPEYRLLMHTVWRFAADAPMHEHVQVRDLLDPAAVEHEVDLWSHQLFEGWYFESEAVRQVAQQVATSKGGGSAGLTEDNWQVLLPSIIRLAQEEFGPRVRVLYARRLWRMAEWLWFAGRVHEAGLAASVAHTMEQSPPEANLSVIRLVQRGVLKALREIRGAADRGQV